MSWNPHSGRAIEVLSVSSGTGQDAKDQDGTATPSVGRNLHRATSVVARAPRLADLFPLRVIDRLGVRAGGPRHAAGVHV